MLIHDAHHLAGLEVFETGPADVVVGLALVVGAFGEDAAGHWDSEVFGLALLDRVEAIEPLDEHEECELFDHGKRIGDPAGPERV